MDRPVASAPTPVHAFASAATPRSQLRKKMDPARRLRPDTRPRFCKRGYPRSQLRKKMDPPVASAPAPVHAFASAATPVASFARRWTRARRLRPGTRPRFCKRGYPRSQLRKKMDPPVAFAPTPVHAFASAATPCSQLRQEDGPAPAASAPTPVHAFASAATPRSQLRKKMDPRPSPSPQHPSTLLQARLPL